MITLNLAMILSCLALVYQQTLPRVFQNPPELEKIRHIKSKITRFVPMRLKVFRLFLRYDVQLALEVTACICLFQLFQVILDAVFVLASLHERIRRLVIALHLFARIIANLAVISACYRLVQSKVFGYPAYTHRIRLGYNLSVTVHPRSNLAECLLGTPQCEWPRDVEWYYDLCCEQITGVMMESLLAMTVFRVVDPRYIY